MYDNAEPPPQRRDNGLRADTFVALADVDPRLGEHLLDLLRLADIAAYLEPPGDPRVATRYRVAGPIERLFVQSDLRRAAREVVLAAAREAGAPTAAAAAPGDAGSPDSPAAQQRSGFARSNGPDLLKGLDTDAEFARIMAGYDVAAPPRSSGAGQDAIAQDAIAQDAPAQDDIAQDDAGRNGQNHAAHDEDDQEEDDQEEDDHFVPPAAPPFPIPRGETVGALVLFLFGLLVIARGDWLGLGSNASFPIGVVLVLTAIVLLIKGLHDSEPDDVDPDDGAIV